jgi:hypothetical protein
VPHRQVHSAHFSRQIIDYLFDIDHVPSVILPESFLQAFTAANLQVQRSPKFAVRESMTALY